VLVEQVNLIALSMKNGLPSCPFSIGGAARWRRVEPHSRSVPAACSRRDGRVSDAVWRLLASC
jgi:hypothetical protein